MHLCVRADYLLSDREPYEYYAGYSKDIIAKLATVWSMGD